jgi:hypothetical protein
MAAPALAAGLVTVSGPSPFATCQNAGEPGTVYVNGEVEPYVAVNPSTVGSKHVNVIGVWQQDRWNNGGAHGLVAGASFDGGSTWTDVPLPLTACSPNAAITDPFTGAPYYRGSDPWVSIGPDGTAYTVGLLATNTTAPNAGVNDTGIATMTSSNGGKTWGNARLIKADQGNTPFFEFTQFFNDKESITADPLHAGTAYVVWDRLVAGSHAPDSTLHTHSSDGPTWFSKTTDSGQTWTGTRAIFDPGENSQTIGNVVVVDPNSGKLYDFFADFQTTGSPNFIPRGISIGFVSSSDGGNTWSDSTTVSSVDVVTDANPNDPSQTIRTEQEVPSVAIDPVTGELYVVWEDARFTGSTINQVVISTSTNGGKTWTAPAVVSGTPTNRPAFTPTVAVNSTGTVAVTYYDMRKLADGQTSTLPTDFWIRKSPRGAAAFGPDTHVAGSFNMLAAPNAGGFFVGDYEAIGVNGATFLPFFVQTNCATTTCTANPTDVYAGSF